MAKQFDEKEQKTPATAADQSSDMASKTMLTPLQLSQIYALIDSILPFEACLYYQVLPLEIDGSRLIMGTVNLEDPAAEAYVTKQLSYINYSIRFKEIDSEWHRDLLSQYLKYTAQQASQAAASTATDKADTAAAAPVPSATTAAAATPPASTGPSVAAHPLHGDGSAVESSPARAADRPKVTTSSSPKVTAWPSVDDQQMQATLILDQVEELTAIIPREEHMRLLEQEATLEDELPNLSVGSTAAESPAPSAAIAPPPAPAPAAPETPTVQAEPRPDDQAAIAPSQAAAPTPAEARPAPDLLVPEPAPVADQPAPVPASPPPPAPAPAAAATPDDTCSEEISELLCALPPRVLMQALLDKVTGDGIGRLYLERKEATCRILWSCNGVLEGLIEPFDGHILQKVINELKHLTHMTLMPVTQPEQVEIERTVDNQRILLRLQVMPGDGGEQATLQVLRGSALEFHQQRQIDRLGRDALDAAQALQHRLNAMRDRARSSLNAQPTRSEVLPTLIKLMAELEAQVKEIEAVYEAGESTSAADSPHPPGG